jgi:hypothetical protein
VPSNFHLNGAIVGAAWWNQGLRVVTRHAVRYVAVLAVVAVMTRWVMWRRARRAEGAVGRPSTAPLGIPLTLWARYALAGLILGATWAWHEHQSPWGHALRVAILLLLVGPVIRFVRRRYAPHWGHNLAEAVQLRGWLLAKLLLIFVAIGLEILLRQWLSYNTAAEFVALCLGVTVALGGPPLHRWLAGGWHRRDPAHPTGRPH